jgi:uncharacterized repeat protein (TIGR03803 family)
MRRTWAGHTASVLAAIAGLGAFCLAPPAVAGTYKVLYSFCSVANCADGASPGTTPLIDQAGDIFGATVIGGNAPNGGSGVIYELTPNNDGTYAYQVIYSFCAQPSCADGSYPIGSLVMGQSGALYGATVGGGARAAGEVYQLVPKNGSWTINVLASFCPHCAIGDSPESGLTYAGAATGALYDETSPLFGTTESGGFRNGGVIYEVQPQNGNWVEQAIYALDHLGKSNLQSALIMDASGNLYGAESTVNAIYKLSPSDSGWSLTRIFKFACTKQGTCPDGATPNSVIMNSSGQFLGFDLEGGAQCNYEGSGTGCGTIYSLNPGGVNRYKETRLHEFCAKGPPTCEDGADPWDAPILDAQNNIFGTASAGGAGGGTLFELDASGAFSVLHQFATADGTTPYSGVALDSAHNLYGTTWDGGANGQGGTIYEYTP